MAVISHLTASSKTESVTPWTFALVPLVATLVPVGQQPDPLGNAPKPPALFDYFVAMKVCLGDCSDL
eukprot:762994-Hanusia_phi.AAC.13